jgi:hypothetical protein
VCLVYDLCFTQPAVKLLDFFRQMSEGDFKVVASEGQLDTAAEAGGLTNFSTSKIRNISKTVRELDWSHWLLKMLNDG